MEKAKFYSSFGQKAAQRVSAKETVGVLKKPREANVNCSRTLHGCGVAHQRPRRLKPAATGIGFFN
ncbi:MAG: hypothetical protein AB1696_28505, partial [Planctomycetota bacterium]